MKKSPLVVLVAVLGGGAAYLGLSGRQSVPLSQLGSVSQVVNTTTISVTYSRPVARGRELFGPDGVVPFGEFWNPGANDATWIEFSKDVVLAGESIPAGSYSLWADPGAERWQVALSRDWDVFHIPYPGVDRDLIRIALPVGRGEHVEVMTFDFSEIGPNTTSLSFQWGTTRVVFPIEVEMELPPAA